MERRSLEVLLPGLTFALMFLDVYLLCHGKARDKRRMTSAAITTCLFGLLFWGMTEILSLFQGLTQTNLTIAWLILLIVTVVIAVISAFRMKENLRAAWEDLIRCPSRWFLVLFLLFAACIVFLDLRTVPYNNDSMHYHLSRITHWAQNGSISHYASNVQRQISSPPFAEYVNLHVYLLSGGRDKMLNLFQGITFLYNGLWVYAIAGQIRCSGQWRRVAAVLFFSVPIAFVEAFSTQNDQLPAMWLLIFVYLTVHFLQQTEPPRWTFDSWSKIACMGVCISLGYLTKSNIMYGILVFFLCLLFVYLRQKSHRIFTVKAILFALLFVIIPILPESARMIKTFGTLFPPEISSSQLVLTPDPRYWVMNLVKHLSYNMGQPLTGNMFMGLVTGVANVLQLDPADPAVALAEYHIPEGVYYNHDTAQNPQIVWLLIIALCWRAAALLYSKRKGIQSEKMQRPERQFVLCSILSFVFLLCFLRWNIFQTRFELAYLAVLCVTVARLFETILMRKKQAAYFVMGAITCWSMLIMSDMWKYHYDIVKKQMESEPHFGYFSANTDKFVFFQETTKLATEAGWKTVGVFADEALFEYQLWKMLPPETRIEHIMVGNQTGQYEDETYTPDGIFWFGAIPADEVISYNGAEYSPIVTYQYREADWVSLFQRTTPKAGGE